MRFRLKFCGFIRRPAYVLWTFVISSFINSFGFPLDSTTTFYQWTPAIKLGLRYCAHFGFAMSEKKCCVPNCGSKTESLHKFPNPAKYPERFRTWLNNIGGEVLDLEYDVVYNRRRVCHLHFEPQYHTRSKFLSVDAVPRLCLPGSGMRRSHLMDLTNIQRNSNIPAEILPPQEPPTEISNLQGNSNIHAQIIPPPEPPTEISSYCQEKISKKVKNVQLTKEIKKLKVKNMSYRSRLKKAIKLSTNTAFQSALKKFKTLAAIFTVMQFREISKPKMARRFTNEEKTMALSVYKMGPKAYRWLSKIFVLPSPVTLSRMVSRANLKPGINDNIFEQLKKRIVKMKDDDKLCSVLFDEMAITPHFEYNQRKDKISGFVNKDGNSQKKIADHVLVFMIRGLIKNYKQPIYYSFCSGSTPKESLAAQIKEVIKKLQSIGFIVVATVCDQGTSNTSAINYLIEDTKRNYLRKSQEYNKSVFEIDGQTIIPLYDVPHLLKGIRNNLLAKNLIFEMDGQTKTAKWEHITQLYENNPTYKGLKIIKNLTENHCNRDKIPKMKVKYASQLFSQTVGKTMGYLAENGILTKDTQDTADFILFIDNLFDSLNGSFQNSNVRSGKELLRNVKPNSKHKEMWLQAKTILKTMKFETVNRAGTVPSITNWVKTIENMCLLSDKLFDEYKIKSFWCRHLNQDPLENFFGSIRSHGIRNISPTCAGFESAFASLLVNNMSSNYSPGSNCEEDSCTNFESFEALFFSKNKENKENTSEIDLDDLHENILNDFNKKKTDPRIIGQLEYVTGYILRKSKKISKTAKHANVVYLPMTQKTTSIFNTESI